MLHDNGICSNHVRYGVNYVFTIRRMRIILSLTFPALQKLKVPPERVNPMRLLAGASANQGRASKGLLFPGCSKADGSGNSYHPPALWWRVDRTSSSWHP